MGGSNCALPVASGKLVVYSRKWQAQPVQQAGWHTLYWKTSRMPPLQCPRVPETLTPGRAVLRCSGGNGTTKICHCSTPPVDTTTLTVRSPSPTMNSYSPGRVTTTLVAVEFLECSSIDQSLAQHGKVVNLSVPETNRNQRRAPQYTRASIRKKNRLNAYPCFFRLWRVVLEPIHSRNSFPSCRLVKRLSFFSVHAPIGPIPVSGNIAGRGTSARTNRQTARSPCRGNQEASAAGRFQHR